MTEKLNKTQKIKFFIFSVILSAVVLFCTLVIGGWQPKQEVNEIDRSINDSSNLILSKRIKRIANYYDHESAMNLTIVSIDGVEYVANSRGGIIPLVTK